MSSNAGLALGNWNGVTTFNVADATGNSDPDLIVGTTLQDAVSTDGSSGTQGVSCLVKTGAGTMKLTGALQISGFVSVYDGTLDLASATVVGRNEDQPGGFDRPADSADGAPRRTSRFT